LRLHLGDARVDVAAQPRLEGLAVELASVGRRPGGVERDALRQPVDLELGLTDVGENVLQEARAKYVDLPDSRTHFIGHVQTNKAKPIAELFDVVQSVDRVDAGRALARAARNLRKALRVLVQLNVSPYDRFGIAPDEALALADVLRGEGLVVDGVMAIGPFTADRSATDRAFAKLRRMISTAEKAA